jgi:penicillin-binding protein 1C
MSSRKRIHRWLWLFLLPNMLVLCLWLLDLTCPLPAEKIFSKVVLADDRSLLAAYLTPDQKWRMETRLGDVTPELVKALINKEDKYFFYHSGINPVAVFRALASNIVSGRRVSGASTITMQLARLIAPTHRTYGNKLMEMLRAMQLEWHYPKQRILELYLSYAPFGGNVEGIKAASYIYFDRSPAKLSLAQDVLLMVVPNRPNSLRLDRFTAEGIASRNKWLRKFSRQGLFDKALIKDALDEPVVASRHEIPLLAPHFSTYVKNTYLGNELHTSLSLALQKKAEDLLYNHAQRTKAKQVTNGAVIVIDNRSMEVKAYCGSADFTDVQNDGQVNGAEAYRSPGSTLKPLLYALAMDKGMITPKSQLLDVPTNINGYVPENFDLRYRGQVTADFALVQSLNIPAIRLLNAYGVKSFAEFLSQTENFKMISKKEKQLGLSMILGGCGLSLHELAHAYTAFANNGELKHLYFVKNEKRVLQSKRLFTPEAAFMITDILSYNNRPDIPAYLLDQSELPKVAFKTGTSFGRKDAWAVGVNPQYTIAVWMGNFDGNGAPELSGADMAVPLLFDLFNAIDTRKRKNWFAKPANVWVRRVCKESGLVADSNCASAYDDYYIRNVSSQEICHLYKQVYVSNDEKMQYCTACLPKVGYKKKTYPKYPAELVLWFKENGRHFSMPPPHNPQCEGHFADDGPKILSPSADMQYFLDEDAPREIRLQAASDATVTAYYWYIDDKFYQRSGTAEKVFFLPKPGKHKISCMDDKGRSTSIVVDIEKL